ncbi:MAG: 50S ribosomal protein L13 [Candidatus Caenarcaniphilales bacterium]|nr:50S ribosomal protein L13 [Candidatus Caenarcaniphilales bacterium]
MPPKNSATNAEDNPEEQKAKEESKPTQTTKAAKPPAKAASKTSEAKTAAKTEKKTDKKSTKTLGQLLSNKTKYINAETADRKWFLIDAKDKNLGRMCVEIAKILRGKRKASFTPNADAGDFVVVINAKDVDYTGKNKGKQTLYYRYTGYPGGLRTESLENLLKRSPEKVIMKTVKGMLPKNTTIGDKQLTKLKVYAGSSHPHSAQNPTLIDSLPLV